jgi:hypothetical protein
VEMASPGRSFTILAFVKMQPDTEASESRQQALVLESFIHQHTSWGVRGALADYAPAKRTSQEEFSSLRNAFYDWGLQDVAFVLDPGGNVAQQLDVSAVPSTFIVSGSGCVVWAHPGKVSTFELEVNTSRVLKRDRPEWRRAE